MQNKKLTFSGLLPIINGLLMLLLFSSCGYDGMIIAIQPIGPVPKETIKYIQAAVDSVYKASTTVNAAIPADSSAFVNIKTPRFKADKLIALLKKDKPRSVDYVMGITGYDISTTKHDKWGKIKKPVERYEDFGIFGLGYRPGPSCIVSTYRLGGGQIADERLAKIAVHEVGHNLGLHHCPNKKCVMTDAVEKMETIDNAELKLCDRCRREIE